ncbi:FUSC family protein [Spelaeicoccus albus]
MPKQDAAPWGRGVRTAVAVATPVTVGMAVGNVVPTVLCSLGAMSSSFSDKGGPYRTRLARFATVIVSGATGFLIGGTAYGHGLLTVAVVMAAGLISSLMSRLSAIASTGALQFLLFTIVSSGISFGPLPVWVPSVLYAIGGLWTMTLSLSTGIGRTSAPQQALVADVYRRLAALLDASRIDTAQAAERVRRTDTARQAITTAMNAAYDAVLTNREQSGGTENRSSRLTALLNGATPIVEAALTIIRDGRVIPADIPAAVDEIGLAIAGGGRSNGARALPKRAVPGKSGTSVRRTASGGPAANGSGADDAAAGDAADDTAATRRPDTIEMPRIDTSAPALEALEAGIRSAKSIVSGRTPAPDKSRPPRASAHDRLVGFRETIVGGRETWWQTVRLILSLGVADAVGQMLGLERSFWVVLSVAVVMKPDFGSVFARAVQRTLGTVIGVAIGAAVVAVVPSGAWMLIPVAFFAFMLPISIRRNYGMLATFVTPLIVLLLDLIHHNAQTLVEYRLIDTAIGCAIVLLVGYLPWPSTWRSRTRIGERIAVTARIVLTYMRVALAREGGDRSWVRRHTYRSLSDLRTAFQQAMSEPPPVSTRASAWWPAIVALERLTDATTAVALRAEHGEDGVSEAGARQAIDAMREIVESTRSERRPRDMPLPDEAALEGVRAELRSVYSIVNTHARPR